MTFDPSEDYQKDKVCLTIEGEFQGIGLKAYSSPDAKNVTYLEDGAQIGERVVDQIAAPFPVDIVLLQNTYPQEGDVQPIREEVADEMSAQFDRKVDEVFENMSSDPSSILE